MRKLYLLFLIIISTLAGFGCTLIGGEDDDDGGGISPGTPDYPQTYAEPSVSPDGSKLLFVRNKVTRINKAGFFTIDPDSSGIWLAESDGSNMKLLIQSQNLGTPSFSPDMEWVLFEGGAQIYKVPFATDSVNMDSLVQLTFEGRNFFPDWIPDGRWIAYDNTVCGSSGDPLPPNSCGILRIDNKGAGKKLVARGRMPDWSIDGKRLVYIGLKSEIFTIILDDSTVTMLTSLNQSDDNSVDNRYPKYSLDGTQIAFQSDGQVWIMQADGSNPRQLHEYGKMPAWYGNGKVVFIDFNPHRFTKDNGTIWIMNADGSGKQQLTFNYGLELEE